MSYTAVQGTICAVRPVVTAGRADDRSCPKDDKRDPRAYGSRRNVTQFGVVVAVRDLLLYKASARRTV